MLYTAAIYQQWTIKLGHIGHQRLCGEAGMTVFIVKINQYFFIFLENTISLKNAEFRLWCLILYASNLGLKLR